MGEQFSTATDVVDHLKQEISDARISDTLKAKENGEGEGGGGGGGEAEGESGGGGGGGGEMNGGAAAYECPEKLEKLRPHEGCHEVPQPFLCPLRHVLMRDPVLCDDGHSYQREAILEVSSRACKSLQKGATSRHDLD